MQEKLKSLLHDDTTFYMVLLLLVAVISFGLGRQSMTEQAEFRGVSTAAMSEIVPLTPNIGAGRSESTVVTTVVASKSGTKYHLPTCPGAKQIKESNIIEFTSIQAAEAAGYTAAANCSFSIEIDF